jgi:glycosyltransferase involved in cell wall biosynthesis
MKPAVVITTCVGREDNLKRTLGCLAQQTFQPRAVCIVYDGCPPFRLPDTPFRVLTTVIPRHKPGEPQPRNVGFQHIRDEDPACDYVWFLDSDLIFKPDVLAAYATAVGTGEPRILIGPYDWLAEGEKAIGGRLEFPDPRWASFREHGPKLLRYSMGAGLACFGGNLVWPVREFEEIGGFHINLHHARCEDGELGLRACERGVPMQFVGAAHAWHVWHPRDDGESTRRNERDVPLLNRMHPWVEKQGLRVVAKDGKRFDWKCPDCDGVFNSLNYWDHAQTHR